MGDKSLDTALLEKVIREQEARIASLEKDLSRFKEIPFRRAGGDSVIAPEPFKPIFKHAQDTVNAYFKHMQMDPSQGTIEIANERYVLMRASALSLGFLKTIKELYADRGEKEAMAIGMSFLFDIAHVVGLNDARDFHKKLGLVDPIEKLSAGPVHFAHSGWALVEILPDSKPSPDDDYFLRYNHPYSFEADSWIRSGALATEPVCIMNAGYSSGWCEESFGISLTAKEITCRARGDDICSFIMAPPTRIQKYLNELLPTKPEITTDSMIYDIPTFFKRKEEEETLQKNLQRAQQMETIGQLAGGVAHDFNNQLSVIMGYADLLKTNLEDDESLEFARNIVTACKRSQDLTSQMLAFARKGKYEITTINIHEVIGEVVRWLERSINKQINIKQRLGANPPTISGDETQIQNAFLNIAINARDAMDEGGDLIFETSTVDFNKKACVALPFSVSPGKYLLTSITDQGVGMDKETMEHAFEPFFTTKGPGKGTGMGLAAVYGTVQNHHGTVSIESEVGKGTTLKIYLPLLEEAKSSRKRNNKITEPAPEVTGRILVVDDEEMVLKMCAQVLRRIGHKVTTVSNGKEAVEYYRKSWKHIDLVILDMVMPELGGRDTFIAMREINPEIKAILSSGYSIDGPAQEILDEGVQAFIQKPFDTKKLSDKVAEVLGQ